MIVITTVAITIEIIIIIDSNKTFKHKKIWKLKISNLKKHKFTFKNTLKIVKIKNYG